MCVHVPVRAGVHALEREGKREERKRERENICEGQRSTLCVVPQKSSTSETNTELLSVESETDFLRVSVCLGHVHACGWHVPMCAYRNQKGMLAFSSVTSHLSFCVKVP